MPAFLEQKLKAEYGANSSTPYKIMNKLGLMRGSRETPRGRAMQAKHERDVAARRRRGGRLAALMGKA
jgi:hypothetical protein